MASSFEEKCPCKSYKDNVPPPLEEFLDCLHKCLGGLAAADCKLVLLVAHDEVGHPAHALPVLGLVLEHLLGL